MSDADRFASEAMRRATNGHLIVVALRKVSQKQSAAVVRDLEADAQESLELLRQEDFGKVLFSDLNPFSGYPGGSSAFKENWVRSHLTSFEIATAAAGLILAHSVIDAVVDLLTQASVAADPASWLFHVRDKTFRLQELERSSPADLQRRALHHFTNGLSRENLLLKLDRLFKVCKPAPDQLRGGTYRFSRERLKRLDTLRHTLVHGSAPPDKVVLLYHVERWKTVDDDLEWLAYTPMKLCLIVAKRHDLSLNPSHLL
jgi:hypothetical protein